MAVEVKQPVALKLWQVTPGAAEMEKDPFLRERIASVINSKIFRFCECWLVTTCQHPRYKNTTSLTLRSKASPLTLYLRTNCSLGGIIPRLYALHHDKEPQGYIHF